eukprot:363051-Chlamydomonas_euryale.AAC.7
MVRDLKERTTPVVQQVCMHTHEHANWLAVYGGLQRRRPLPAAANLPACVYVQNLCPPVTQCSSNVYA